MDRDALNGWEASAQAWIDDMGDYGDYGRRYVLDPVMLDRVRRQTGGRALDVGCGEGRFCRLMTSAGYQTVGIDPVLQLIERARSLDDVGRYEVAAAERLPFGARTFDLVVSYLSLIDIEDYEAAIAEMARVLAPGGLLLVANLTGFNTARVRDPPGASPSRGVTIERYLEARSQWESWRGIRVRNWHRPLSAYLKAFLRAGLRLTYFDEPAPLEGDPTRAARYLDAPWYVVMEWRAAE